MQNFISVETSDIQICEYLIKNEKNSEKTREMDNKLMPVMKAESRVPIHLPLNTELLPVYEVKGW